MEKKTDSQNEQKVFMPSVEEDHPLDNIIQKQGYEKGRLFFSKDRATYTFLDQDEVLSLHFDFNRRALFLNGRKILNRKNHPELERLLELFKRELVNHNLSQEFLLVFGAVASQLEKT